MSYRQSHLAKGQDYHDTFGDIPLRKVMWQCEQAVLNRIVSESYVATRFTHLDFACGTGRIIGLLRPFTQRSVGIDVSESMLAVARSNVDAEFVRGDLTTEPLLGDTRFDLITAFRFFPNAEPELRNDVMEALVRHLAVGGRLVFNNHMNTRSLVRRAARLFGGGTQDGMCLSDVKQLVDAHGLKIARAFPLGLLPLSERRTPGWLAPVAHTEAFFSRFSAFAPLAQNTIFVCQRKSV